jgi:hypothetical protein
MLRGGQHGQHGGPMTADVALASTEDAFAVLPQDLTAAVRIYAIKRILHHLSDSGTGLLVAFG